MKVDELMTSLGEAALAVADATDDDARKTAQTWLDGVEKALERERAAEVRRIERERLAAEARDRRDRLASAERERRAHEARLASQAQPPEGETAFVVTRPLAYGSASFSVGDVIRPAPEHVDKLLQRRLIGPLARPGDVVVATKTTVLGGHRLVRGEVVEGMEPWMVAVGVQKALIRVTPGTVGAQQEPEQDPDQGSAA